MAPGSVFFVILTAVFVGALVIGMTSWLVVPIAVILVGMLLILGPAAVLIRKLRLHRGPGSSGVPTTREASYEPVADPDERPSGR